MKKQLIFLIIGSFFTFFGVSQTNNDNNPKHINCYKIPEPIKTGDVTISFDDAVSKMDYVKLKVKITNNTADYIMFNPSECIFEYKEAIDKEPIKKPAKNKEKFILIKPYDKTSKIIETSGDINFHKDSFELKINGLYKVSSKGNAVNAPDYQLPVTTNKFDAGNFSLNMTNLVKETKITEIEFKCIYNGNGVGIIEPSRVVIKLQNGQEFATTNLDAKTILLEKGEDDKFFLTFKIPAKITDMQFATMFLTWKLTFAESTKDAIPISTFKFKIDEELTAVKNK
ncbi:MAG: hypothetical protein WC894_05045 [Patescibacteria group bacterium]